MTQSIADPLHRANVYIAEIDSMTLRIRDMLTDWERKHNAHGRFPNWADITPIADLRRELKEAMHTFEETQK